MALQCQHPNISTDKLQLHWVRIFQYADNKCVKTQVNTYIINIKRKKISIEIIKNGKIHWNQNFSIQFWKYQVNFYLKILNNIIFVHLQLFYSFFKSLVGKDVVVELKNDLRYCILSSQLVFFKYNSSLKWNNSNVIRNFTVYAAHCTPSTSIWTSNWLTSAWMTQKNIHTCCTYRKRFTTPWIEQKKNLLSYSMTNILMCIHFRSVKNCFIRGSVVRYVQLPGEEVDTQLLQDAARKEAVTSTR